MEIGFIGFGLIGGSLAMIWKNNHSDFTITAYNYHEKPSDELLKAKADGVIDDITNDIGVIAKSDMIVLAAPVMANVEYLKMLAPLVGPDTLITDVGSSKAVITKTAIESSLSKIFIGGHPMAGSEKTGYSSGSVDLFKNAWYFLTPNEVTEERKLSFLQKLVAETGANCVIAEPSKHDRITAAVSHLPHLASAALTDTVAEEDLSEDMAKYAAGGFRDTTRIASSSPAMWRDICLSNPEAVADMLTKYIHKLNVVREMVLAGDGNGITELFNESREYRATLSEDKRVKK